MTRGGNESELHRLTASGAAALLGAKSVTAEGLARACLARMEGRDPLVRAWAAVQPEHVVAAARELDRAPRRGPLHGIPIGVKDVIDVDGLPTQYNSPLYQGHRPAADADCIALLRHAGALIFGKTATVEFAAGGRRAPTRNPHDLERTPGGSSSGSAAAVADFHVPIALGTQSAGSVIRPASYCGIYGMKPTWGTVGRDGIKPYAPSLDTPGWFARSVADLRLVAEALCVSLDPPAPAPPLAGARIAVCRTPAWPRAEPATVEAVRRGATALQAAGAVIVDLTLPPIFDGLIAARRTIASGEGRASFLAEARLHGERLHADVRAMPENRSGITGRQMREAYDHAASGRAAFDDIAAQFTAILAPSAPGEASHGLESTGDTDFNEMWTLLHVPCVNLRGLSGPNGLPVGLTLVGRRFSDLQLLAAAEEIAPHFEASSP
ncbi:MAG TPA: amidase [Beijerinckiaceae bacterium]|nr:amidase [Beijerinckiaceae bacterium]